MKPLGKTCIVCEKYIRADPETGINLYCDEHEAEASRRMETDKTVTFEKVIVRSRCRYCQRVIPTEFDTGEMYQVCPECELRTHVNRSCPKGQVTLFEVER